MRADVGPPGGSVGPALNYGYIAKHSRIAISNGGDYSTVPVKKRAEFRYCNVQFVAFGGRTASARDSTVDRRVLRGRGLYSSTVND